MAMQKGNLQRREDATRQSYRVAALHESTCLSKFLDEQRMPLSEERMALD